MENDKVPVYSEEQSTNGLDTESQNADINACEKMHKCDLCGKKFITSVAVLFHKRTHNDKYPRNCNICNRTLLDSTDLEIHAVYHKHQKDNANLLKCNSCNKLFSNATELKFHKMYHDAIDAMDFHAVDPKPSTTLTSYQSHTEREKCNSLDKAGTSSANITQGTQPRAIIRPIKCSCDDPEPVTRLRRCRQTRTSRQCKSKNNVLNLTDEEIYNKCLCGKNEAQCGICQRTFSCRSYLKIHVGSHTSERPFPCDICNKSFLQRPHLVEHERIHTGTKPYKCDTCDKSFAIKGNLKKHKIVHTNVKLYKCDICDDAFARLFSLERHLKGRHKRDITPICKVCNQTHKRSCHLANHQRKHKGKRTTSRSVETRTINHTATHRERGLSACPAPQIANVEILAESCTTDNARTLLEPSTLVDLPNLAESTKSDKIGMETLPKSNKGDVCATSFLSSANTPGNDEQMTTIDGTMQGNSVGEIDTCKSTSTGIRAAETYRDKNMDESGTLCLFLSSNTPSNDKQTATIDGTMQGDSVGEIDTCKSTSTGIRAAETCRDKNMEESGTLCLFLSSNTPSNDKQTTNVDVTQADPSVNINRSCHLANHQKTHKGPSGGIQLSIVNFLLHSDKKDLAESRTICHTRKHKESSPSPARNDTALQGSVESIIEDNVRRHIDFTAFQVAHPPRLTESRNADDETTMVSSKSENSNTTSTSSLFNSHPLNNNETISIDLTPCDELSSELEATTQTGMTYICFECDTEFKLPWQLLNHVEKVHPDQTSSN